MKRTRLSENDSFVGDDLTEIVELVGKDAAIEHGQFSVARTITPPNTKSVQHYHEHTEELFIVTRGSGLIVINDVAVDVSPGDIVLAEKNERHYVNSNTDSALELLAICLPAYDDADVIVDE